MPTRASSTSSRGRVGRHADQDDGDAPEQNDRPRTATLSRRMPTSPVAPRAPTARPPRMPYCSQPTPEFPRSSNSRRGHDRQDLERPDDKGRRGQQSNQHQQVAVTADRAESGHCRRHDSGPLGLALRPRPAARGSRLTKKADQRTRPAFAQSTVAGLVNPSMTPASAGPAKKPTLSIELEVTLAAVSSSASERATAREPPARGETAYMRPPRALRSGRRPPSGPSAQIVAAAPAMSATRIRSDASITDSRR